MRPQDHGCSSFFPLWCYATVLLVSSCVRIGFDTHSSNAEAHLPDALHDTAAPTDLTRDTSSPDASCQLGPFASAQRISQVNSSDDDWDPFISSDGKTLLFASWRGGGDNQDIWMATRSSVSAAFGSPVNLSDVNTADEEFTPFLTADGLRLYFASTRPGGQGQADIWLATRASTSDKFSPAVNVVEVNSPSKDEGAFLTPDELTLYLASTRGSSWDIWVAVRSSKTSKFSAPVLFSAVNSSSADDRDPRLSANGLEFYITSSRQGGHGGGSDIWVYRRNTAAEPFSAPTNLGELNTPNVDCCAFPSSDGASLFFIRDRTPSQLADIWVATRTCVH
jgi:Tol biopolymer transport system component